MYHVRSFTSHESYDQRRRSYGHSRILDCGIYSTTPSEYPRLSFMLNVKIPLSTIDIKLLSRLFGFIFSASGFCVFILPGQLFEDSSRLLSFRFNLKRHGTEIKGRRDCGETGEEEVGEDERELRESEGRAGGRC